MIKCVDPSVLGVLRPNPYSGASASRGSVRTRGKSRSSSRRLRRTSTTCAIRTSTSCARCRREPCGNRITASARWRGGQLSSLVDSSQVAHRAHHEEVRPRQDVTPCPSLILPAPHHRSSLLSMQPPEFAIDPEHWAYLPASCTSIPPRAYPPASTPSDTSYLTKVVYIF